MVAPRGAPSPRFFSKQGEQRTEPGMVRAQARCGEGERMAANRPRTDRVRIKTDELDPASETLDHDYFAFHKGAKKMPERQRQAIEAKFQAAFAERSEEHTSELQSHSDLV